MSTSQILDKYAEKYGWDIYIQLELLCDYIDNQDSPDALEDFLADAGDPANDDESEASACGGCGWHGLHG